MAATPTLSGADSRPTTLSEDLADRYALAHDASHFFMVPSAIARPQTIDDLIDLFHYARSNRMGITFRSGGTSLSGQASSEAILAEVRRGFRRIEVLDDGLRVFVEPGVNLRKVNAQLARYGRRLGPDPASEIACTVGGIIANNSSGMACGITENAYQTIESATLVFSSGTVLNTASPTADSELRATEPQIYESLSSIRDAMRLQPGWKATVKRLFSIKNTMGFSLNAFLDFERPVDILLHLIVGSEGTLAFVANAIFRTVPTRSHEATGLWVFPSVRNAIEALPRLKRAGVAVAELLDSASLGIARSYSEATDFLPPISQPHEAALLLEIRAENEDEMHQKIRDLKKLTRDVQTLSDKTLTTSESVRSAIWKIRKGLFASIAATRLPGELSLLEDIAVPTDRLLPAVKELETLLIEHGYSKKAIFGHAKDGNIHFLLNQSFSTSEATRKFEEFTEDLVQLVLRHEGTLKAEHGTGRMMAPYLERQYGSDLYELMVRLKSVFDPENILNPGVIINSNPRSHVSALKYVPPVEKEVDRCVDCGYCEPICPSNDLTFTPRQRIGLRREMEQARLTGDKQLERQLRRGLQYRVLDSCAVDGLCSMACPVNINTGELVSRLRGEGSGRLAKAASALAARNWAITTGLISTLLNLVGRFPSLVVHQISLVARKLLRTREIPLWTSDLPRGGSRRTDLSSVEAEVVFLAGCTGAMFGSKSRSGMGVEGAFLTVCKRAGVKVATPPSPGRLCCGTPWSSKGLLSGLSEMKKIVVQALGPNARTVVVDASSCSMGYRKLLSEVSNIEVLDATTFLVSLLPQLVVTKKLPLVALHPTCSGEKLGITEDLLELGRHISEEIFVPRDWGCCAFAGDRGMLVPELTASATSEMSKQIAQAEPTHFASSNRTCEIGMSRATGENFVHIVELVEEATRPD